MGDLPGDDGLVRLGLERRPRTHPLSPDGPAGAGPSGGRGLSRRGVLGGALGGAAIGTGLLAMVLDGSPALAATAGHQPPPVHSRGAWQARPPKDRAVVLAGRPDHIVVHHTATPNTTDFSVGHAYELSRGIQHFHMYGRGWSDIGEQLTISRGGHVMEGRNRSLRAILAGRHVVGAQTLHHNSHTLGIENEGTYMRTPVPAPLWSSLVGVCAWLCSVYDLNPYRAIVGHRDYNSTDCPGDVLYARLPELRRQTAHVLHGPGPAPIPKPPADTRHDSVAPGNAAPGNAAPGNVVPGHGDAGAGNPGSGDVGHGDLGNSDMWNGDVGNEDDYGDG